MKILCFKGWRAGKNNYLLILLVFLVAVVVQRSAALAAAAGQTQIEVYTVDVGECLLGPTAYDFDNPLTWTRIPATPSRPNDRGGQGGGGGQGNRGEMLATLPNTGGAGQDSGGAEMLAYSANANSYMVASGNNLTNGMFKDPVFTGLNGSSNPNDLDHCGAWLSAVHWDAAEGVMRGFYHQEWKCNYSHSGYTNMSIAYAESHDRGKTFTKPGHPHNAIITAPNSSSTHICGEGGHGMAVRDGYYYIYFRDWSHFGIGVARATMASGGTPGSWYKYYNGDWTQPGIRGNASRLSNITGTSAYYSSSRQRFISVGYWSSDETLGRGTRLSYSSDGLHWTPMLLPLVPLDPQVWNRTGHQPEQNAYQALAPVSDTDDVLSSAFFYSYTFVEPGATRLNKYLCRKRVDHHVFTVADSSSSSSLHHSISLIKLGHYRSHMTDDIWVTSAAVPRHHGYDYVEGEFPPLPLLATADWASSGRDGYDNIQKCIRDCGHTTAVANSTVLTSEQLQWLCAQRTARYEHDARACCYCLAAASDQSERDEESSRSAVDTMVALYDCVHGTTGDHFVSQSSTCDSQQYIRILGYVQLSPASSWWPGRDPVADAVTEYPLVTAALYSCWNSVHNDTCVDASPTCHACGGTMTEVLGHGFHLEK